MSFNGSHNSAYAAKSVCKYFRTTNHNATRNMSNLMTAEFLADVDRDSKMIIVNEGLQLLHNGSGKACNCDASNNIDGQLFKLKIITIFL